MTGRGSTPQVSSPRRRLLGWIWGGLLAALVAPFTIAQVAEKFIGPLSALDRQYMEQQRQSIRELTLRYYGGQCCRRVAAVPGQQPVGVLAMLDRHDERHHRAEADDGRQQEEMRVFVTQKRHKTTRSSLGKAACFCEHAATRAPRGP